MVKWAAQHQWLKKFKPASFFFTHGACFHHDLSGTICKMKPFKWSAWKWTQITRVCWKCMIGQDHVCVWDHFKIRMKEVSRPARTCDRERCWEDLTFCAVWKVQTGKTILGNLFSMYCFLNDQRQQSAVCDISTHPATGRCSHTPGDCYLNPNPTLGL